MNQKLLALHGLKFSPFSPELPIKALHVSPKMEDFCWRIEKTMVQEGGFVMVTGDPGSGKSVVLRVLHDRLTRVQGVNVGVINHPQSSLGDLYREMGDVFNVSLRSSNRWNGFKVLREGWISHLESCHCRPVLIIDEAQEMSTQALSELRLLSTSQFDSRPLLCVILAGDTRLQEKLRSNDLLPLGSRIRARYMTDYAKPDELMDCLEHLIAEAGNASLMTEQLRTMLCEHSAGNYRALTSMCAELLSVAAQKNIAVLDEKLYFDVFSPQSQPAKRKAR